MWAYCHVCQRNERVSEHASKITHRHCGVDNLLSLHRYKVIPPKGEKKPNVRKKNER